jgi:hypothetical protein
VLELQVDAVGIAETAIVALEQKVAAVWNVAAAAVGRAGGLDHAVESAVPAGEIRG